jgi:molecular chaperone GrpE
VDTKDRKKFHIKELPDEEQVQGTDEQSQEKTDQRSDEQNHAEQRCDHEGAAPYPDREGGDDIATLENRIDELLAESKQLVEDLQRERASFLNYRQRIEEEKTLIRRYGAQDLAFDLLNVIDYFEASLNFDEKNASLDSVVQGVKFTIEEFKRILAKYGIEEIKPDIPFDPRIHEAFGTEVTDKAAPGTILAVHRKGYIYKDKVLRAAMVTIAQAPETPNSDRKGAAPDPDRKGENSDEIDQTELGSA